MHKSVRHNAPMLGLVIERYLVPDLSRLKTHHTGPNVNAIFYFFSIPLIYQPTTSIALATVNDELEDRGEIEFKNFLPVGL